MFHRPGKKSKPKQSKALKDLNPILSPEALLKDKKRQQLLGTIKQASHESESRFSNIYIALLNNFLNHCQSLPETFNNYYSLPGGLLDHALNRTEAALTLFSQYLIQEGSDLSDAQKLWLFVLFSAGLLQGIGKLQIDYKIDLFDSNGQKVKLWNPLLESMPAMGAYYQYEFCEEQEDRLRRRLNLLLARMLMPAKAFAWIASNPEALAVWLALLNEDYEDAGTLGAILIRADAIALQRYFTDYMVRMGAERAGGFSRIKTFVDSGYDSLEDKEHMIGLEFLQWLMQQLEAGIIMINKAPLFMVPGGMLMSSDMFKWFVREHPEYKNWQAIQSGLLSINVHQTNADGAVESRFEQSKNQQIVSGVVLADYAVALPDSVKFHDMNTGKVSTLSAVELVHQAQYNSHFSNMNNLAAIPPLAYLAANGQWQVVESSLGPQQGAKFSG